MQSPKKENKYVVMKETTYFMKINWIITNYLNGLYFMKIKSK